MQEGSDIGSGGAGTLAASSGSSPHCAWNQRALSCPKVLSGAPGRDGLCEVGEGVRPQSWFCSLRLRGEAGVSVFPRGEDTLPGLLKAVSRGLGALGSSESPGAHTALTFEPRP